MKRVLVCEDDKGIRGFLDHFVRRKGHTVDVAVDGTECLEMIGRSDYDAILLDLMMPMMNGYEVLNRLRISNLSVLQRTIVISASPGAFKNPPADVAAFFSKPFDVAQLIQKLDAVLTRDSEA